MSSAVGYWAAHTAGAVASELRGATPSPMTEAIFDNFQRYRSVCSQERLHEYDAHHNLSLTSVSAT